MNQFLTIAMAMIPAIITRAETATKEAAKARADLVAFGRLAVTEWAATHELRARVVSEAIAADSKLRSEAVTAIRDLASEAMIRLERARAAETDRRWQTFLLLQNRAECPHCKPTVAPSPACPCGSSPCEPQVAVGEAPTPQVDAAPAPQVVEAEPAPAPTTKWAPSYKKGPAKPWMAGNPPKKVPHG